jgi:hypothetical protein
MDRFGSVCLDDKLTDLSMERILFALPDWVMDVLPAYTKQIVKNISKNSFYSQFISRWHRLSLYSSSMPSQ